MNRYSVLFPVNAGALRADPAADPAFFSDLNLDQIAEAMLAGREGYDLRPFFRQPLPTLDAVHYRHEVMRDLEAEPKRAIVEAFARQMRAVRESLGTAAKLHNAHELQSWVLDAACRYCAAVEDLHRGLLDSPLASRGLCGFRDVLTAYRSMDTFRTLASEAASVRAKLAAITYSVLVHGEQLSVRNTHDETDLAQAVLDTFDRFRQGAVKSYLSTFHERPGMNHIEAKVLEFVAMLHEDVFGELDRFAERHAEFIDPLVQDFDREVQFYLAAIDFARAFDAAGLPTCYPQVEAESKSVCVDDGFDAALAFRLIRNGGEVVRNDFELHANERVFVVSGPNQGGKTTFARTFGQLQYLGALGLRTPGSRARTFLFDRMFTHFEREEDPASLRGKLEDDIIRIHEILEHATPRSVIILNEMFASTTARDAAMLARDVMERVLALDVLCVFVTFIDELSAMSEKTVSVVSLVDPADLTRRTYKLERRPADGLAYAVSLAEKHGLTYERLTRRLGGKA